MKTEIPLGKETSYVSQYDSSLLFPIAREKSRRSLKLKNDLPFKGEDCWTAFEVSWLDEGGKPEVRLGEFYFDITSPNIIESKSFKLYLNSFNQTRFKNQAEVIKHMQKDLTTVSGKDCELFLYKLEDAQALPIRFLPGECIDELELDFEIEHYEPEPNLLIPNHDKKVNNKTVYSHLLKTNCPVTDQPDWATIFIEYSGSEIILESLLAYIISFREHQDFHENCVERIFCDLKAKCNPSDLTVCARYTRRGGLDINPLRTTLTQDQFRELQLRINRQ